MKINISSVREHGPGLPWGLSLQILPNFFPVRSQCVCLECSVSRVHGSPTTVGTAQSTGGDAKGPGRTTVLRWVMDQPRSNSDGESIPLPAAELDLVQPQSRRPEIKAFCYLCLSSSSTGDPTLLILSPHPKMLSGAWVPAATCPSSSKERFPFSLIELMWEAFQLIPLRTLKTEELVTSKLSGAERHFRGSVLICILPAYVFLSGWVWEGLKITFLALNYLWHRETSKGHRAFSWWPTV